MQDLEESLEKQFTVEGRCSNYNGECEKDRNNTCIDEPVSNIFGIKHFIKKCCSSAELSNDSISVMNWKTLFSIIPFITFMLNL
ncbi:unnamed protein product [Dracunculus medinensis]|uniref:Plasmodium vivax Vir protein n=1 Tax=Dracunculus medinensis TaxID=318479 RepID=A0A0N4UB03_DRAME|nr:unnamed protein product [Dracunculus medinensis]